MKPKQTSKQENYSQLGIVCAKSSTMLLFNILEI